MAPNKLLILFIALSLGMLGCGPGSDDLNTSPTRTPTLQIPKLMSALEHAKKSEINSILKKAIDDNTNLDISDAQERSPLHYALLSEEALEPAYFNKLLKSVGTKINKPDQKNTRPLDVLMDNPKLRWNYAIIKPLLDNGMQTDVPLKEGDTIAHRLFSELSFDKAENIELAAELLNNNKTLLDTENTKKQNALDILAQDQAKKKQLLDGLARFPDTKAFLETSLKDNQEKTKLNQGHREAQEKLKKEEEALKRAQDQEKIAKEKLKNAQGEAARKAQEAEVRKAEKLRLEREAEVKRAKQQEELRKQQAEQKKQQIAQEKAKRAAEQKAQAEKARLKAEQEAQAAEAKRKAELAAQANAPLEIYKKLAEDSNEKVLIQRAAVYLVDKKTETDFFDSRKTSEKQKNEAVDKVIKSPNFKPIFEMMDSLLPVHRCSRDTFKKIDSSGFIVSLETLATPYPPAIGATEDWDIDPYRLLFGAKYLNKVVNLFKNKDEFKGVSYDDLSAIVRKASVEYIIKDIKKKLTDDPASGLLWSADFSGCKVKYTADANDFKSCKIDVKAKDDGKVESVYNFIQTLYNTPPGGIGFSVDKIIGTYKYVFSIQGFNRDNQGYGGIPLVLEKSLLSDPKTWATPLAAASYYKMDDPDNMAGYYGTNRPWITPKPWSNGGKEDFEASKITNSTKGALALVNSFEMLARYAYIYKKDYNQVKVSDLRTYMIDLSKTNASHYLMEIHLPDVPVEKIKNIILQDNIDSMYPRYKNISEDKKIIVPHVVGNDQKTYEAVGEATEKISAPR